MPHLVEPMGLGRIPKVASEWNQVSRIEAAFEFAFELGRVGPRDRPLTSKDDRGSPLLAHLNPD